MKLISNILLRLDTHMQELLRGASIAMVFKIIAAGIAFGLNVVLAKMLGAEGTGIFFLSLTLVMIVSAMGRVGMENALVRFVAANFAEGEIRKVLGVYRKAIKYSLIVSVILSLALMHLSSWVSHVVFSKPELERPLDIMALAVVPIALLTLHANALQGLKKIAESITVLSIIVPFLTSLSALFFVPAYGLDAATYSYLVATIVTLIISLWWWRRAVAAYNLKYAQFDSRELLSSSIPLLGGVLMNMVILWSPILFLGIWETNENIGIYSAASRTAMLTSFVLVAVNSIAAPKFAALYQQGDFINLERMAQNSNKFMIALAIPIIFVFMAAPERVLSLFGEQFTEGAIVLMIIAAGQFVNVATGSVGYLLMMSGNERLMRNNLFFNALICIILNMVLIPAYGIIGAATGAALIMVVQNLVAMVMVWKKLNIITIPWFSRS